MLEFRDDNPPPLEVKVTDFNRHEHLNSVVSSYIPCPDPSQTHSPLQARQKGGIGSAEYDPNQQSIRAFFGGGAPVEEGRATSNAYDENNINIGD